MRALAGFLAGASRMLWDASSCSMQLARRSGQDYRRWSKLREWLQPTDIAARTLDGGSLEREPNVNRQS
jgi:hypothetical protein